MKVEIYVEGTSDKYAMEALLSHLIEEKLQQGIRIEFFPVKGSNNDRGGNAKKDLLIKTPTKAVDIIQNNPTTIVVIMPDLYPQNVGFDHQTIQELENGILDNFNQVLQSKRINDSRLIKRFRVFCFKHNLEALILAAESQLISVLGVKSLAVTWTRPVEDQNHNVPPKNIVEEIFRRYGNKYKGTVDAPRILGNARYQYIAEQCPQAFGLFVEFLENIQV